MNKTAFRLFLCCTLIAALTALLLLCFNFFCFCILGSDYSFSLEKDTVHSLAGIEEALSHPGSQVPALPEGQWCILIAESGDVIWQENMPADIPSHYSINDVARFTRWFISDYPVYVRTTEQGLLVLGLPIFDTAFAIVRRVARGQSPMTPDRGHIHHRMMDMGLNQKQTVAALYVVSSLLGLSAVVLTTSGELKAMLLLLTLAAVAYVASRVIFPREIAETAHEKELEQEETQAKPAAPAPEEKEEKHEED